METWQNVICGYCAVAIFLCLFNLWKMVRIRKKYPENERGDLILKGLLRFIISFLILLAAMVATLAYMAGEWSFSWPVLLVIGLMLISSFSLLTKKK